MEWQVGMYPGDPRRNLYLQLAPQCRRCPRRVFTNFKTHSTSIKKRKKTFFLFFYFSEIRKNISKKHTTATEVK